MIISPPLNEAEILFIMEFIKDYLLMIVSGDWYYNIFAYIMALGIGYTLIHTISKFVGAKW